MPYAVQTPREGTEGTSGFLRVSVGYLLVWLLSLFLQDENRCMPSGRYYYGIFQYRSCDKFEGNWQKAQCGLVKQQKLVQEKVKDEVNRRIRPPHPFSTSLGFASFLCLCPCQARLSLGDANGWSPQQARKVVMGKCQNKVSFGKKRWCMVTVEAVTGIYESWSLEYLLVTYLCVLYSCVYVHMHMCTHTWGDER